MLLGGLEVVAAGYLIHKHQKHKKERQRLEEEKAALEESQYRIFPQNSGHQHEHERSDSPQRHRHFQPRSHSRRRDTSDRRHSHDERHSRDWRPPRERKHSSERGGLGSHERQTSRGRRHKREGPITQTAPTLQSTSYSSENNSLSGPSSYPLDVKYGWTDDVSPHIPVQHEASYPQTGRPAHQALSHAHLPPEDQIPQVYAQGADALSNRSGSRPHDSRVRFAVSGHVLQAGGSREPSPPPSYRP